MKNIKISFSLLIFLFSFLNDSSVGSNLTFFFQKDLQLSIPAEKSLSFGASLFPLLKKILFLREILNKENWKDGTFPIDQSNEIISAFSLENPWSWVI